MPYYAISELIEIIKILKNEVSEDRYKYFLKCYEKEREGMKWDDIKKLNGAKRAKRNIKLKGKHIASLEKALIILKREQTKKSYSTSLDYSGK